MVGRTVVEVETFVTVVGLTTVVVWTTVVGWTTTFVFVWVLYWVSARGTENQQMFREVGWFFFAYP